MSTAKPRLLTEAEQRLLRFLLPPPYRDSFLPRLAEYRVAEMTDGHMGSLRVDGPTDRTFGKTVAEWECRDRDGTPVSVAINVDKMGQLFEIDIWRVDFAPLLQFPEPPKRA